MSADMVVVLIILFVIVIKCVPSGTGEKLFEQILMFPIYLVKFVFSSIALNSKVSKTAYNPLFKKLKNNHKQITIKSIPDNKSFYGTLYDGCEFLEKNYEDIIKNIGNNNYIDMYSAPNYKVSIKVPFSLEAHKKYAEKFTTKDLEYIDKYLPVSFAEIPSLHEQAYSQSSLLCSEFYAYLKDVATYSKGKLGRNNLKKAIKDNNIYKNTLTDVILKANGETIGNNAVIVTGKGVFVIELKNYGNSDDTLTVSKEGTWTLKHKQDVPVIINDMAQLNNKRCAITQTVINNKLKEKGITDIPFLDCISVICIANDDVRISNFSNHILCRTSNLIKIIENHRPNSSFRLTPQLQNTIIEILRQENMPLLKYNISDRTEKIKVLNSNIDQLISDLYICGEIIENYNKHIISKQ